MSIQGLNSAKTSHILGVDFGASKVGLALADTETKIAFAHNTLPNDKNFLEKITEIIKKENIFQIVIGVPSYINKKTTVYEGEKLGCLIKDIFPQIKIDYQNEMFTTKMAQDNLLEKGMRGVGKMDDSEAARIILQNWLDKNICAKIQESDNN